MKILLTDDLYTNRLYAGITIRAMGHAVEEASDGEAAINMISKNDYDLILMDIEMPVRNGLETTRFIREQMKGRKSAIPIIAITAHNPEDYFDNFKHAGFDGLISKPITRQKLEKHFQNLGLKFKD
jgi:two-component system, response regulator, stage 0 sporulation protein F